MKILLVEDNSDDIELTRVALKEGNVLNKMDVARDGQEALDYFQKKCLVKDASEFDLPGLILLDINLPKINGIEVLKFIKKTEKIKRIPVVMLTTSKRDEDIIDSYDLGVNSYIQKPVEFDKFVEMVASVKLYWLLINTPPVMND